MSGWTDKFHAAAEAAGISDAKTDVLRWLLQRGLVVIPCSSRAERIASNRSEADGWELSAAEVEGLFMLDEPASTAAEAANYW